MSFTTTKVHHVQDEDYRSGCHAIVTEGYLHIGDAKYGVVLIDVFDAAWKVRHFQMQEVQSAMHKIKEIFHELVGTDFYHKGGINEYFCD